MEIMRSLQLTNAFSCAKNVSHKTLGVTTWPFYNIIATLSAFFSRHKVIGNVHPGNELFAQRGNVYLVFLIWKPN